MCTAVLASSTGPGEAGRAVSDLAVPGGTAARRLTLLADAAGRLSGAGLWATTPVQTCQQRIRLLFKSTSKELLQGANAQHNERMQAENSSHMLEVLKVLDLAN